MKRGQAMLIILLMSTVVMTVGLTISRRTVSQTKISTDEEMLKEAFNAAESGIDYYKKSGANFSPMNVDVGASIVAIPDKKIMAGTPIKYNNVTEVNLNLKDFNGSVKVEVDRDTKIRMDLFDGSTGVNRFLLDRRNPDISVNNKKYLKIMAIDGKSCNFTITPSGDYLEQSIITSTGYADKKNPQGVKTQITKNEEFNIPYFLMEAIGAGGEISN